MRIFILGAGKLGRALKSALERTKANVRLQPARKPLPTATIDADLVVLAVRDGYLPELVRRLARGRRLSSRAAVVHMAGALGPDVLAPLKAVSAGVGQAHPMLSFASPRVSPTLRGGHLLVTGDPVARSRAARLGRMLGMVPHSFRSLDRTTYHAAAGLVANGAAALAAAGVELLALAGVPRRQAPLMLGPLLRSVSENVERLGIPEALTGPVRRGDAAAVSRHLSAIEARAPALVPLYRASARAQLPMAERLADAPRQAISDVRRVLDKNERSFSRRKRRSALP
jgi:predicted short-subunit dehydrogenase-like oxidoreductase (DUF2520 family)